MKKLFLLSCCIFFASVAFAQQFEVSEQAGASFTNGNTRFKTSGFANLVALGYHPLKHVEISAFYELNKWGPANNSFGISVDYTTRHFFAGLEGKYALLTPYQVQPGFGEVIRDKYNPALGYGVHVGAKQKLVKRIWLVVQLGYVVQPFTIASETVSVQPAPYAYGLSFEHHNLDTGFNYLYARAGVTYRL